MRNFFDELGAVNLGLAQQDNGTRYAVAFSGVSQHDCNDDDHKHDQGGTDSNGATTSSTTPIVVPPGDIAGDTSTAVTIAIGESVTSELETVGDTDWIRIELTAGDEITISLYGSGPNPVSDTYLRLYDANGVEISFNDDGGTGLNSLLRFVADNDGTYYIEVDSYANQYTGQYTLEVTETVPLAVYDYDQIADQLTEGYWGGPARSYDITDGQITYDISALPAEAQYLATQALALWADITGINFVSRPGSGEITFQDTDEGAYASSSRTGTTLTGSTVNVSADWLASYGTTLDSYSFQTYVHEIGHALGLGHGGNYNGSADYSVDALYANDSWATTVMSYFSQPENFYFQDLGFSYAPVTSPMNADVVAAVRLYGASTTTRTGNTTYGFNSNSNRDIHDASLFNDTAYTIVDSGGIDTLDYRGFSADQLIDLNAEVFMNIGGLIGNVMIGRGTVIENAIGGSGSDNITGNEFANSLRGGTGADTILGRGGADMIYGEAGSDILHGNGGVDQLFGGTERDYLYGGNDGDTLNGEGGNDVLVGNYGADTINGGGGDDLIFAGYGNDTVSGGDGRDEARGGFGNDTLYGGQGTDALYGGAGDDTLFGELGMDFLYGGNGADTMFGGEQNDRLEGDAGNDLLDGGDGDDNLLGGADNDVLDGGAGADLLRGGTGNDTLRGSFGDDDIGGGDGADRLEGGLGQDLLTGGSGSDIFFFDEMGALNADTITDFSAASDTIALDSSVFSSLSAGSLLTGQFRIGSQAGDADDRIIYDSATGNLYYDADGAGGQAQVLFANLSAGLALTNANFVVEDPLFNSGPDMSKGDADLSAMPDFVIA